MSALYQRARPYTFDQVVGQEHVKDVLAAAVARGLTGHAYLFSGPRGVGKTTTARLMAMAVNCEREPAERPCGECESCRLVRDGAHPDVLELDAASNNSVEDVRALRERVGLASLRGGTRVWILDEAHMLSRAAANALLKTLEEPPPGLMFVLATTEPEKLPPTILSRCQHFRFRRLTDAEILGKLKRLCEEGGVAAEEAALALVARAAEGAMRDAESLLERLLVGGGPITAAAAEDALGLPPRERLVELADALVAGDLARLLPQAGELYRAGFAPRTVAEQLGRTLRDRLHEALAAGHADEARLVALIHALDDELERFSRRDDLYGLEVALIKAVEAGRATGGSPARGEAPAADEPPPFDPLGVPTRPRAQVPSQRAATAASSGPRTAAASGTEGRAAASAPGPSRGDEGGGGPRGGPAPAEQEPPRDEPAPAPAEARTPAAAASEGPPAAAGGDGAGGRRSFSWHAVRTAATPQLKAFLQPAQATEEGGVVTLEFGESWRFHYEQVLARQAELEELVARVAGPGFTVALKGPKGSGSSARRRPAPAAARAPAGATAQRSQAAAAPEPAPRRAQATAPPEPAGPGRTEVEAPTGPEAAPEPEAPPEEDEPYESLPDGFWDDYLEASPADGAAAPAPVTPGTSLAQLQSLFPGRVVEFRPNAPPDDARTDEAAPDALDDEAQGYDEDGQDRLEPGAAAPDDS
ncbi:MAG TPA: DNA polymerase III subunit gamma/tau [Trueperaceae bacterium]|nr:DNA polymerase III subunit gamma/tau [Trueperaceae bacterium]